MDTSTGQPSEFRKTLNQVEKYIVLGSFLILLLVVLGLFFIQQMVSAQGQGAAGFYAFFGSINMAGFMLAVPVTVGLGLQMWRMSLYTRGILSGQLPDYVVMTILILASVTVELYVFLVAPVRPISPNMPRYVIAAYLLTHVGQALVEAWTDYYAKRQAMADAQQVVPVRSSNHQRKFRPEESRSEVEVDRESVSPKR